MIKTVIGYLFICVMLTQNTIAQSYWDMEPSKVRDLINARVLAIQAEKPEVQKVNDITINCGKRTTPLRIYVANECDPLPIILLIHGGAWVAGNLDTHDNLARYLCKEVQALVVSVGYRNSPEGKFPLLLEQCYDALLWITEHAQAFRGDPTRLAVVGDSAGGNMAAALCLLARDRKGPTIDLQVLINPAIDLTGGGTIQRQGDDEPDLVRWYATQYVADPKDANSQYVSPIVAKDLTNLPSAVVILAERDYLRKAGQEYADRLISAGISTNVYIQWGVGHLAGNGARVSSLARESIDIAVAALRGAFYKKAIILQPIK